MNNIVIIGASGAIGYAFVEQLASRFPVASLWAFSRQQPSALPDHATWHSIDYTDETSIEQAARLASAEQHIDLLICATGILHTPDMRPEKGLKELSAEKFQTLFAANTLFPALVMKHFAPHLAKDHPSILACLSARVGSISDNRLGGWYSYRASKAALNMIIKNTAIEVARTNKQAIVVGLHPGTVDSRLSEPFQANVPESKLFSPQFAVEHLLEVLLELQPSHSGKLFAWDGEEVAP